MKEFVLNSLFFLSIVWICFAVMTVLIARSKNRSPAFWVLIGMIFGAIGLLWVLMLPKKEKVVSEQSDPLESRLKYLKMKKEFEESKK